MRFRILLFLTMWFAALLKFELHGYILHFFRFLWMRGCFWLVVRDWGSGRFARAFRQPTMYVKFDDRDD